MKILLAPWGTLRKETIRSILVKNLLTQWETEEENREINNMFVDKKPLNPVEN